MDDNPHAVSQESSAPQKSQADPEFQVPKSSSFPEDIDDESQATNQAEDIDAVTHATSPVENAESVEDVDAVTQATNLAEAARALKPMGASAKASCPPPPSPGVPGKQASPS